MKKKKLKKRIKKLEKESQTIADKTSETLNAQLQSLRVLRDRISTLDNVVTINHNSCKSEFGTIKANKREMQNEIDSLKKQIDILKQRTETDYTQFKPLVDTSKGPDTVSKTCDTCLYNGMGLDGPCMGCTAEDLKMYKQKEN